MELMFEAVGALQPTATSEALEEVQPLVLLEVSEVTRRVGGSAADRQIRTGWICQKIQGDHGNPEFRGNPTEPIPGNPL